MDPHPGRVLPQHLSTPRSPGSSRPSRCRGWAAGASPGRAARCWAARRRSTGSSISAASGRISTIGASSAMPAGRMTTCCRISAAPRTRSAAPTITTAPAARCRSPICARHHELHDAFIAGAQEAGFKSNPDFNGAEQEGVGSYQLTVRKMRRVQRRGRLSAPGDEAPQPARSRSARWRIACCSTASARSASNMRQDGAVRRVRARREVLLAGGSIQSPQLLQLSGVGPGALLHAARHRRWCTSCPASARICRTISAAASSTRRDAPTR